MRPLRAVARSTAALPDATTPPVTETDSPLDRQDAWDDVQTFQMIAENAYYRAERRGFMPGDELADWLAAEQEVRAILDCARN